MKKVLAFSLVFALLAISVTAQNPKTEQFRKQRMEQRMMHMGQQFRHPGIMKQRNELMKQRMMKQRIMRGHVATQKRALAQRKMQMQHRKMMLRRHLMHRRVI